jgi:hypothetical protein
VTNNHVVDHAKSVQVTTDDGAVYTAKVVGADPKTDLALIKVDGNKDFPFVKFAERAPQVGDWVVAVGNPFGLGGTVTAGIVSARGRDIGAGPYDDYLQIDAPINKGNSGGPAFDVNGNAVKDDWKQVLKVAAIKDFRRHDLRHNFASALISMGFGLSEVGSLLGHSNPTTTARYAHLVDERLRAASKAAGEALFPRHDAYKS